MTRSEIPILDLKLRCGASLLDVSLWRDEALTNLHEDDQLEISHLHASLDPKGNGKFNSSAYTTIKVLLFMHYKYMSVHPSTTQPNNYLLFVKNLCIQTYMRFVRFMIVYNDFKTKTNDTMLKTY